MVPAAGGANSTIHGAPSRAAGSSGSSPANEKASPSSITSSITSGLSPVLLHLERDSTVGSTGLR